jgi:MarR family transcriptional regulator, 2-MHQ and catechol-resistance regulon repressor
MRNEILGIVSLDLLSISPLIARSIRRKLIRSTTFNPDFNITPLHFEIMRLLAEEGTLHVSEIGDKLQVAKAQMTKLIDKLAALNLIERTADASDRRTLNVTLSSQGSRILKENKNQIMLAVQEIVASLPDEDLEKLSLSLRTLRDILLKAQRVSSKENAT